MRHEPRQGYFVEQLIKFIPDDLITGGSKVITHATIVNKGNLTEPYNYLKEYAGV